SDETAIQVASAEEVTKRQRTGRSRILGVAEMSRGRWAHALDRLDAATSEDPLVTYLVAGDRIEAAIRSGKRGRAADALSEFEVWATTARPASAQVRLSASSGLLAGRDRATRNFEQ